MKTLLKLLVLALFVNTATAQFTQHALPYAYDALEPNIDAQTMEIHFSKHHAGYIKNLNAALAALGKENETDIMAILNNISGYNTAVRNNAGGHYNHTLFWNLLTPEKGTQLSADLAADINATFGDFDTFKAQFVQAAATRFGSGWAWLIVTPDNKLAITSTPNQDNPLMDDAPVKGTPILGIDVWEHAYYLKFQNKRGDYLQSVWDVINWNEVSALYAKTK
jgi:Fe-Mn family superoxide dismutase